MQIQAINNHSVSFGKKFTRRVTDSDGREYVLEYENPNAEKIYKKYLNAKTLKEKGALVEQLGDYHIVDVETERWLDDLVKDAYLDELCASETKMGRGAKAVVKGVKTIFGEMGNWCKNLYKLAVYAVRSKRY